MAIRTSLLLSALLFAGTAQAQTPLPSSDEGASPPAAAASPKPGKAKRAPKSDAEAAAPDDKKEGPTSGVASIVGKVLRLNGGAGELVIERGDDKALKVVTLKLSGEVISSPNQKCEISIIGNGPIAAASEGAPDGLPRFAAEVPACPLSFDVVGGGVITPPQTRACVFQAADCQASPSGVWGPEPAALASEAKTLAKERAKAEASIADSLKALAKRNKGSEAELQREQSDFNALRDETCRAYLGEAAHGYCDARMTQARAALLRKQAAKAEREKPETKKKKG